MLFTVPVVISIVTPPSSFVSEYLPMGSAVAPNGSMIEDIHIDPGAMPNVTQRSCFSSKSDPIAQDQKKLNDSASPIIYNQSLLVTQRSPIGNSPVGPNDQLNPPKRVPFAACSERRYENKRAIFWNESGARSSIMHWIVCCGSLMIAVGIVILIICTI